MATLRTRTAEVANFAKEAGCPRDQVKNFLLAGYIPLKWQWSFHAQARKSDNEGEPVDIGAGGARGPGKSVGIFAQMTLDDLQRYAGLKGLFIRQTSLSAKESFEDLIEKLLRGKKQFEYAKSGNTLTFPNKSKIVLGGFKDEKDIDKYVGIEYDVIGIEELNQLIKEKVEKLKGSLRTSKKGWRPRLYTSFNPGGVGHDFVKTTYITERKPDTAFFRATYKDNPFLNKEYIDYLEGLEGDLGKAWREGDFDLFAGQYFNEWRYAVHVCEPFTINPEWKRFIMGDYGFSKPSAVYWGAVSPDGILYLYRELYVTGHTYSQLADKIISLTLPSEDISYWVFDPSIWSRKGETPLSGAEIMEQRYYEVTKKRVRLIQGDNNRINGWMAMREWLKPFMHDQKLTAKLQVFSTLENLIRTLPALIYDTHKVEDLNTDGEDHPGDAVRYGIMSRPKPTIDKQKLAEKLFTERMKNKKLKQRRMI